MSDTINPDQLQTEPPPSGLTTFTVRPTSPPKPTPKSAATTPAPSGPASAPASSDADTSLTRDQAKALVRKYNPDITPAAVEGEVDNIMRESKGDPTVPGDQGTSAGLYQDHLTRLTGLKQFAAKENADWRDPDIQVRYARLEKERDYPGLLKFQQTTNDPAAAEDQFKRVFERPASVLWQHGSNGHPITSSDRFRFSDQAVRDGADDGDLRYMAPQEFLDLSPELGGKPFDTPSGRALMRSFDRGDQIDQVPSLDVDNSGPTAQVTDQDGRHRALLAQQEGVSAMPVSIRSAGRTDQMSTPKEIRGMSGNLMANDFPRVRGYQTPPATPAMQSPAEPADQSMFTRFMNTLATPEAQAAEAGGDPWAAFGPPAAPAATTPSAAPPAPAPAAAAPTAGTQGAPPPSDPWAAFGPGAAPTAAPGAAAPATASGQGGFLSDVESGFGAQAALLKGAYRGVGETAFGGEELLGKGMQALDIPGGGALTADARAHLAAQQQAAAADQAAHPIASGIGDFVGNTAVPAVLGGELAAALKLGGLGAGALQGGLAAALAPGSDQNYWRNKLAGMAVGAGAGGAVGGMLGNKLAALAKPATQSAVRSLMNQNVELTPGQISGGVLKTVEDKLVSFPILGDAIRAARQRGLESWNRAAYNQVLAPIGETYTGQDVGLDGIRAVRQRLNANYDRVLSGTTLTMSNKYATDLQQLQQELLKMPEGLTLDQMRQFEDYIDRTVSSHWDPSGRMSGETFKKVESILTNQAGIFHRSPDQMTRNFGSAIDDFNGLLRQTLEDQNPGKGPQLKAANAGWARFARIRKAATQRPTNETGVFTPSDLLRASFAGDNTPGKSAFSEGRALFQDFGREGQAVMGHTTPDSGTAGRWLLAEILGGFTTHPEATLAAIGAQTAASIPYRAPASRAINAAVNRLAQPAGPMRNVLENVYRSLAMAGPPVAGSIAPGIAATFAPRTQGPQASPPMPILPSP
jgi:Phage tail lysozyme